MPFVSAYCAGNHQYHKIPAIVCLQTIIGGQSMPQSKLANDLLAPHYMPESIWKKIVDGSRGLGVTYRPQLFNEPLCDERLTDIVQYIKKDPSARVEIVSNGQLLSPGLGEKLLSQKVDKITLRLPGITRQNFALLHHHDYEQVLENTRYFLQLSRRLDHATHTCVEMIQHNRNEDFFTFLAYWKRYQPSSIVYSARVPFPWQQGIQHCHLACSKVGHEISFFVDGTASLCSLDTDGRQLVGDIGEKSLLDIWNGEEIQRCQQLLTQGMRHRLELCRGCALHTDVDFLPWEGYTAGQMTDPVSYHLLEVEELN